MANIVDAMINICIKYGFDILIISGSYGGHKRHRTYDGQHHGYGIISHRRAKTAIDFNV